MNVGADEQIAILGQAIDGGRDGVDPSPLSISVAGLNNRAMSDDLSRLLEDCWPLHPVVACLLGPISRRRFGQNQRSVFGFLNSGEPSGFQDFLRRAEDGELYPLKFLWDYLRLNLEPSIMASPDGHRWALAVDALERCDALGGQELHLRILETIVLVDLFKERSGLTSTSALIACALPGWDCSAITEALAQLQEWSLVIYRKFSDSYSIFEGSDFDVDDAVGRVLETMDVVDFARLNDIAGLHPVVAKRHYHETGGDALVRRGHRAVGRCSVRAGEVPSPLRRGWNFPAGDSHTKRVCREACLLARQVVEQAQDWDLVVGLPQESWNFVSLARELLAAEQVRDESPELQGDRIARREVEARVSSLRGYIESELSQAFDGAVWYARGRDGERLPPARLNGWRPTWRACGSTKLLVCTANCSTG